MPTPLRITNTGSGTIPAYGVCIAKGTSSAANGEPTIAVGEIRIPPQNNYETIVIVNDSAPLAVGASGWGRLCADQPVGWVAYNSGDGSPTAGQMWGVRDSSYQLRYGDPGFVAIGLADSNIVLAQYVHNQQVYAELQADMTAPTSMTVAPSSVNGKPLLPTGGGAQTLTASTKTISIKNRWKDLSLTSSKRMLVYWSWLYLEWVIPASECP